MYNRHTFNQPGAQPHHQLADKDRQEWSQRSYFLI